MKKVYIFECDLKGDIDAVKAFFKVLNGKLEPLQLEQNEDAHYSGILAVIAMYTSPKNQGVGLLKPDLSYYHSILY